MVKHNNNKPALQSNVPPRRALFINFSEDGEHEIIPICQDDTSQAFLDKLAIQINEAIKAMRDVN